jgi:mercuric reductase
MSGTDERHYDLAIVGSGGAAFAAAIGDLADSWDPYLTIGEAIHLAALAFTRDPSKLSCCAA